MDASSGPLAGPRPETVEAALSWAARELAERDVDSPDVDAQLLLAHVLGWSRTSVQLQRSRALDRPAQARFEALVARRARREPLAYVLGEWGFRRFILKTDRRALVPRPETEVVVERCLELLVGSAEPRVLDVGTGSGAIALAVADEHPGARVTAVDVSSDALALAGENAARLGLAVALRQGDIDVAAEDWDLVVSNPPYVPAEDFEGLQPEIRDWEPRDALVGAGFHGRLARAAKTTWLVLEIGDRQASQVEAELASSGYVDIRVTPDLTGTERVVEGRRP